MFRTFRSLRKQWRQLGIGVSQLFQTHRDDMKFPPPLQEMKSYGSPNSVSVMDSGFGTQEPFDMQLKKKRTKDAGSRKRSSNTGSYVSDRSADGHLPFGDRYRCLICERTRVIACTFASAEAVKAHYIAENQNQRNNCHRDSVHEIGRFCEPCGNGFKTKEELATHKQICEYC